MKLRRGAPAEGAPPAGPARAAESPAVKEAPPAASGTKARVIGRSAPAPVTEEAREAAPSAPRPAAGPRVGDVVEATVDRIESFGLFVTFTGGRGLLPISELPVPKGADLRRSYPLGTALKAAIVEIRPDGKLRLSVTAAAQAEERAEAAEWQRSQKAPPGKGFGTLGDLFQKLKK